MAYRCANCGRHLVRQYAQKDGKSYGPVCAEVLGIKAFNPYTRDQPANPKAVKHRMPGKAVYHWGQLWLDF